MIILNYWTTSPTLTFATYTDIIIPSKIFFPVSSESSATVCSALLESQLLHNEDLKKGGWEPNKAPSVCSIGGHGGPSELEWKTNLTIASNGKQWRSEAAGLLPSGVFRDAAYIVGVKVWLSRSNRPAFLSHPLGGEPRVCYNRKRLKVKAQAYCLPARVTDACLSQFAISV